MKIAHTAQIIAGLFMVCTVEFAYGASLSCDMTMSAQGPIPAIFAFTIETSTGKYNYPQANPPVGSVLITVSADVYSFNFPFHGGKTIRYMITRNNGGWSNQFGDGGICHVETQPLF